MSERTARDALRLLAVATVVALAVAAALLALGPPRAGGRVTGRVVGAIDSQTVVLLIEPARGLGVPATVHPDGAFEVVVPDGMREPYLVIDSGRGALVNSRAIDPARGDALGPLAVWSTEARVKTQGPRLRIDWAPVPSGEGYPARAQYSLLVAYRRDDGTDGEATFPSREPALEMADAGQDLLPFLNQRDPSQPTLELIIRAFDPDDPRGPMWIGARLLWRLDTGEVRPSDR